MTERPTPIVPSRAELEAEVGAKSGFEEGIAFAVKAIRERASLISGPEEPYSEAWVVLQKIADDLESASVPPEPSGPSSFDRGVRTGLKIAAAKARKLLEIEHTDSFLSVGIVRRLIELSTSLDARADDARQWLVLPLVWKPDPQDPRLHDLYLGPISVGKVFHWTWDDRWEVEGTGLVGHCSSHPTKELAQAALVEAVMALNKGTDNG